MARQALLQGLGILWIGATLYVWGLRSVPPQLDRLPGLQAMMDQHRSFLSRHLSRPYIWSPEGR